jgi:hypothetical protein
VSRIIFNRCAADVTDTALQFFSAITAVLNIILQIVENSPTPFVISLEDQFSMTGLLAKANTESFMLSLLYYLGVLTLGDVTAGGELTLRIPNLVIHRLYAGRLRAILLPRARNRTPAGTRRMRHTGRAICSHCVILSSSSLSSRASWDWRRAVFVIWIEKRCWKKKKSGRYLLQPEPNCRIIGLR